VSTHRHGRESGHPRLYRNTNLGRKSKQFFFEKKNQKTFAPLRAALTNPGSKTNKVFLLLFVHKKKRFLPYFPSPE
jgi:hypothetical protein